MKKFLYFLPALFFLAGCNDDNEFAQLPEQGEHYLAELPEVVRASVANSGEIQSRTFVDGQNILWHKGDAISYFGAEAHNCKYVFNGPDGTAKADFEMESAHVQSGKYNLYSYAVYPYSSHISGFERNGVHRVSLNFPTLQTYVPNSFGKEANIMVAAGSSSADEELFFRNACGYLVINLYGANRKVRTIDLESIDESVKLSGQGSISIVQNGDPTVEMSVGSSAINMVTLDCGSEGVALGADAAHATAFWFALPPVKMEKGLRMVVTDMDGEEFVTETTNPVEITRNEVQPMQALQFIPFIPPIPFEYATSDNQKFEFGTGQSNPFNANIVSHEYDRETRCYVVHFDAPLTTIKKGAFKDSNITYVGFPEGLTTIEESAFEGCEYLTSLTIPGSVTNIASYAFSECTSLKSVTFEPSPTETPLSIGFVEFSETNNGPFYTAPLEMLELDRELIFTDDKGELFIPKKGDEGLFSNQLNIVTLGPQVKTIQRHMFAFSNIESITIPGTVNKIDFNAFYYCQKLKSITFEPSPTHTSLDIVNGKYENVISSEVAPFCFTALKKVHLNRELVYKNEKGGEYVPSEGDEGIFSYHTGYIDVPIRREFDITFGEQVKTISAYMFFNSPIESITIPASVTSIEDFAFHHCDKLSRVIFEKGSEPLYIGFQPHTDQKGPFFDSPMTYIYVDRDLRPTSEYAEAMDEWDEGIFAYDFWNDDDISTKVSLQSGMRTIYPYMFSGVRMTGCWIPNEVTSIGDEAFDDCEQLEYLTMGSANPPALGKDVFDDCDVLTNIVVPAGSISNYKNHSQWGSWGFNFMEWK